MKKTSAAARTISMFTGKTDLEDPLRARDGTLPEDLARRPRGIVYEWHLNGGHFAWAYGKRTPNETHFDRGWIERNSDAEYHAWVVSLHSKPRVFPTLISAAEWVEDSVARLK